jgi:hypothetical protein
MTIKDGGPAYPVNGPSGEHPGMSLRDYFAAAFVGSVTLGVVVQSEGNLTDEAIAHTAYRMADAMLAARETK